MKRALVVLAALAAGAAGAVAATRPDPATEAVPDGCRRERAGLYTQQVPNWAHVGDRNYPASGPSPPQQVASGFVDAFRPKLYGAHPTPVDNPRSHDSYDFVFELKPDFDSDFLLGAGNFNRGGGEEDASFQRLHIEREAMGFPLFAWPTVGDAVVVRGFWVWDCDHVDSGERTEIHPLQAIWIGRRFSPRSPAGEAEGDVFITNEKTEAGVIADCAHRTKGDRSAFSACLRSESRLTDAGGAYSYVLPLPPKPSARARPRIRVVDMGSTANAPPVVVVPGTRDATVTVRVPQTSARLVVAKRVLVGWTPVPRRARPVHLRVRLVSLLVRRAMDPGCGPQSPPGCRSAESTRDGQTTTAPGEWSLYWDVGGIWQQWRPLVLRVRSGQRIRGRQVVDLYVPRGRPWRLYSFARECDFGSLGANDPTRPLWPCPPSPETGAAVGDDAPGSAERVFPSPERSVGRHTLDARLETSSCPPVNRRGCYSLTVVVGRVRERARG